jgi:uncharacterized protein (DUF1499 family)
MTPTMSFVIPVAGAVLLLLGPLGARAGMWGYLVGFLLVALAVLLAVVGGLLALVLAFRTQAPLAIAGTVLALIIVAIPVRVVLSFRRAPAIHDITTDVGNPPRFERVVALRQGARNPAEYDGAEVAARQRAAYPDLQPLIVALPRQQAFDRALAAARQLGWDVIDSEAAAGRIEAVDTTFWFGFKDDVVIRIGGEGAASRVDVRSKSREGVGDGGTNARRVRAFLAAMQR